MFILKKGHQPGVYVPLRALFLVFYFFLGLMLNVPVNNYSVMLGWNHRFLGITSTFGGKICFAQGHNTATRVGLEPLTSRSGV